ncbi:MAG: redoxin family protein [Planctomycetaceae bacterium]|nr:redoxin family protein [Planctomycetaceae bacterium]
MKIHSKIPFTLALAICAAFAVFIPSLLASDVTIGTKIETIRMKDIRGVPRDLNDLGSHQAYVFVFVTSDCPIVKKTLPKLLDLYNTYHTQDVLFVCVNVGANDTLRDVASQALEYQAPWLFVKDYDAQAAKAIGITRTPQVAVLNSRHELVYRGRVDDQFRLGGTKPNASRDDLKIAIDELLAGKNISIPETIADGCAISTKSPTATPIQSDLNYQQHIAPIVLGHCANCHRPGTAAPFSLLSHQDVVAHSEMIQEVIRDETMPPWYANKHHGKFQNDRSLSTQQKEMLLEWLASERSIGPQDAAPKEPQFEETPWRIGTPDLIITTLEQHTVPATGFVPYKYVVLPHVFLSDTWVSAFEIRPLNPAVVHHCNMAYATSKGASEETFITGYVPGGQPMDLTKFDNGVAYKLPAGSALGLQIHYTTTGQEQKCRIQVGLRFPKEQVRKQLYHFVLDPRGWKIPPGDPAFRITSKHELKRDADLLGLFTHMHVRGRDMTFYAIDPSGSKETLLQLPNYNFEWQLGYELAPGTKLLPKGTQIEAVAHYDNSPLNPYNPDPKATVEYGPQTVDEMFNGFVFYVDQNESLQINVDPKNGRVKK